MGTAETQQLTGIAAHIIKRPRLTKILDETEARIILLCAPAGYGKTTLAREWVATRTEPVYWYSGGPAMADVAALAVDLAELLGGETELPERVRALAAAGEQVTAVARALSSAVASGSLLVIDDFHFAAGKEEPHELIREFLRRTGCRLLLASRVRGPFVDARSAVYGDALVLTVQELAFSDSEAEEVLPAHDVVRENAQGWPAVIGLAAMSRGLRREALDLDPSALYEFLATDMFASVREDLRLDLILLGLGADASVDVAHAVLGARLGPTLRDARDWGFVIQRPDGGISLHPLIREFLVRKAAELEPEARRQAVDCVLHALADHSNWDACLALLRVFPRGDLGVRAMEGALPALLRSGRTTTLYEWLDWAEKTQVDDHPLFILARAELALRRGDYGAARSLGAEATRSLEGNLAARAFLTVARATHQLDLHDETRANARQAAERADSYELRTEATWLEFADAYERDAKSAASALGRLRAVSDPRPEHSLRVACAEAFIQSGPSGNLFLALESAERAVALGQAVRDPYLRTNGHNLRAHLLRSLGEYQRALQAAELLAQEAEGSALDFVLDHARIARAASLTGLRLLSEARRVIRELERDASNLNGHVRGNMFLVKARLLIAAGDLKSAAEVMRADAPTVPLSLHEEFVSSRLLIAAAVGQIEGWEERSYPRPTQYIEAIAAAAMVDCIAALRRSPRRDDQVQNIVARALADGCRDVVVTACRAFPEIATAAAKGHARETLRQLLISSNDYDIGRRAGLEMPRISRRGSFLTEREHEILQLLTEGRSNPEIAKTLFISESTTKVHVKHIFDKLGVRTRAEAVAVALQQREA